MKYMEHWGACMLISHVGFSKKDDGSCAKLEGFGFHLLVTMTRMLALKMIPDKCCDMA